MKLRANLIELPIAFARDKQDVVPKTNERSDTNCATQAPRAIHRSRDTRGGRANQPE